MRRGFEKLDTTHSINIINESREGFIGKPKVTVIIPALNEAENLPHVLPKIPNWIYEVILIPGPSTDGTAEVARRIMPNIRIVEQEGKGKGAALRSGVKAATGDILDRKSVV